MNLTLTPRQQRFVAEYLIDLNATQAAIRAGYSAKNADVTGPRMLGNVGVAAAVAEKQKALAEGQGVTVERIVAELARLGFSNMADYMRVGPDGCPRLDYSTLTRDQAAALQEVTVDEYVVPDPDGPDEAGKRSCLPVRKVKFKLADKRAALVDLGKHLGMFVERQEHSVSITLEALVMQAVELRMARDAPKVIEHDLPRGS